MYKIIQGLLILSAIVVVSCSDKDNLGKTPKLNIEGASSIVVYEDFPTNAGGRVAGGSVESNLYKITPDGNVEKVKFVNDDGSTGEPEDTENSIYITDVYNVNENFMILTGSFSTWDPSGNPRGYNYILVRKDDGAIFEIENFVLGGGSGYGENFQTDGSGNFYFVFLKAIEYQVWAHQLVQVNTSDRDNIFITPYLPTGQSPSSFGINSDGICIYEYGTEVRLQKKSGGIHRFPAGSINTFWTGINGKIYFTSTENDMPTISTLEVDENDVVNYTAVWQRPYDDLSAAVMGLTGREYLKIKKDNSLVFIATSPGKPHLEFFENDNSVRTFTLPDLQNAQIVYSTNHYYIAAGTTLYRVSLDDHSYENILPIDQYEIYTVATGDNGVLISALRFSDGKKIIAEINLQNEITIVEEEMNQDILYLQRLN